MVVIHVLVISLLSHVILGDTPWDLDYDTDGDLSLNDLVKSLGFDGTESHYLTTPDGYIINIQRIKRPNSENLPPIIFSHGLSACADSFFVKKNESSPMYLARQGYDIWLLNSRGTLASTNHTVWNPNNDKEFWLFSWEEIGMYDLPMTIDLVLKHNRHSKVVLIGHSEGSSVIFVTLSEKPEYNNKVALSLHWGVSVFHNKCSSVRVLSVLCRFFEPRLTELADRLSLFAIRPFANLRKMFIEACRMKIFKQACFQGAKILLQSEDSQIEHVKDWSFYINKALCGGTIQELQHFMQVGLTNRFAKFNYGPAKNLKIYNSTEPPLFRLENVVSPTVIWCGKNDIFCTEEDIVKLTAILSNVETIHFRGSNWFSHIDYLVAKDVEKYMYKDLVSLIKKYTTDVISL